MSAARRRVAWSAGLLALIVLVVAAGLGRDAGAGGSRRYGEAVVLTGGELAPFLGATADELWAWAWQGDGWHLLPSQLDERDEGLLYVAAGDGTLDDRDEFVFPLPLHGTRAPEGQRPPGMDADAPWLRVQVSDPLQGDLETTAYLVLSRGGARPAPDPLQSVTWDAAERAVRSPSYVLGFADPQTDGFVGFKRLSLFGAADNVIDRLKLRLTVSLGGFGEQVVTEEALALLGVDVGALTPEPVILGPVRVVLDPAGSGVAYRDRLQFRLAMFGDFPLPPGFSLTAARVSLDLSADALPATYADANLPAGVAIDGEPDAVPRRPLPAWRELSLVAGKVVILRQPRGNAPTAEVYFKDDGRADAADTGDGVSLGDQGVSAGSLADLAAAGFPGEIVIVPGEGGLGGAVLAENLAAPVTLEVVVLPHGATPGATEDPAPTPTTEPVEPTEPVGPTEPAEPTQPVEPTEAVTPEPFGVRLFLPLAHRGR